MIDPFRARMLVLARRAAQECGLEILLVGATARDVLLGKYNINTGRATRDVDIAVAVETWEEFDRLQQRLVDTGQFTVSTGQLQRHIFRDERIDSDLWIDIIPFGGIEDENRKIRWPPDEAFELNLTGYQDAFESSREVEVAPELTLNVVSLSGLSALKLIAWDDRKDRLEDRDAHDFTVIARSYLDAGNNVRLYAELPDLVEQDGFDYTLAGAHLLGYDMQRTLAEETVNYVVEILTREVDLNGNLRLPSVMTKSIIDIEDTFDHCLMVANEVLAGLKR